MESIKFQNQITKFEFVTQGMIQGPKTVDRFLQLHKIYDKNKNKIIKQTSTKIVFDDTEFVLSTNKLPKKTELMKINLIAAIGKFNELGKDNDLCWKISADLKRFKSITTGHFILMGRKTFESFGGRTLPNRIHLVISNTMNESDEKENLLVFRSVDEAIDWVNTYKSSFTQMNQKDLYVIGGGEIYRQTIEKANRLILTCIDDECKDADVFFPVIDMNIFNGISSEEMIDETTGLKFSYMDFTKREKFNLSATLNKRLTNKIIINYILRNNE